MSDETDDQTKDEEMPQWQKQGYGSQDHYDKWNGPFSLLDNPVLRDIKSGKLKPNLNKTLSKHEREFYLEKPTIFVDMDGVLVDFDHGYDNAFGYRPTKIDDNVDWELVKTHDGFYTNLPPMIDFDILWQGIAQYNPIILTGVPKSVPSAAKDKRAWVDKHIGKNQPMITCLSKDKNLHMKCKGDIMIDDWDKYRQLWLDRSGRWITHSNAETSLQELEALLSSKCQ